ncbi:MAG: transglycosylase domain-containing protein, partial [Geminicoccaceae bacterium]
MPESMNADSAGAAPGADPGRRRKFRRVAGLAALLTLGTVVAGLLLALAHLYQLPLPARLEQTRRIALDLAASDGAVFAVRGGSQARMVELSQMPRHLIDAVLAMEDRRFFEHSGFDLGGVLR